jgi:hypothetical protein
MEGKIAQIKKAIQEEETQHKQVTGKDLPANRKIVSKRLGSAVSNWLEQIKNGGPICEEGHWNFAAGIDPKAHQLRISALTLDLENDDMTKVAKVASRLSMIAKQLPAYLLRRRALEKAVGGLSAPTGLDDTTMLRDLGLDDLAQELEHEAMRVASLPASEDADDPDTEEVEERDDAEEEETEPEESLPPAPPPLPERPAQVKTPPAKDRSSPPLKKAQKPKEG